MFSEKLIQPTIYLTNITNNRINYFAESMLQKLDIKINIYTK